MVMKLTEFNSVSFPYDITLGSISFEILELSSYKVWYTFFGLIRFNLFLLYSILSCPNESFLPDKISFNVITNNENYYLIVQVSCSIFQFNFALCIL